MTPHGRLDESCFTDWLQVCVLMVTGALCLALVVAVGAILWAVI